MDKLDLLIIQHFACKQSIDTLKSQHEQIKDNIKYEMDKRKIDVYEDSKENKILYKEQVRRLLDRKKVEQELSPKVFKQCFKESISKPLNITTKEYRESLKNKLNVKDKVAKQLREGQNED